MKEHKEREQQAIVEPLEQPTNQIELDGILAQEVASKERRKHDAVPSRRRTRASGPLNSATVYADPSAATGSHQ